MAKDFDYPTKDAEGRVEKKPLEPAIYRNLSPYQKKQASKKFKEHRQKMYLDKNQKIMANGVK